MPAQRTLVVFKLGSEFCGLAADTVQEILPMALLAQPPGLPPLLEGFLNLRGKAVPVLRLGRLLDCPARPIGLYTPLIVLAGPQLAMALLVDAVTQIISVPEQAFSPIGEKHCFQDCAEAEVALEGQQQVIHLLSSKRLLLEKERRRLAEWQAIEQRRLEELEAPPR